MLARSTRAWRAVSGPRCFSTQHDVSEQLRDVMRDVPQPVAVAVTRVPLPAESLSPSGIASGGAASTSRNTSRYHGTTLSSFTSLTLHPYPLVAFSIRLPSRMADYLRTGVPMSLSSSSSSSSPLSPLSSLPPSPSPLHSSPSPSSTRSSSSSLPSSSSSLPSPFPSFSSSPPSSATSLSSSSRTPSPRRLPQSPNPTGLTISLLSRRSQSLAHALSQPLSDQSSIYASDAWTTPDSWKTSDPPAAAACIGSLRCEVVSSTLLRDMCDPDPDPEPQPEHEPPHEPHTDPEGGDGSVSPEDEDRAKEGPGDRGPQRPQVHGSELFICRVLEVTPGPEAERDQPLLYWRQQYAGVDSQNG